MSIPPPPASGGLPDPQFRPPTPPAGAQIPVPPGAQIPVPPTAAQPIPPAGAPQTPKKTNLLALVAMIVAIVGFVFACIPGALIVGWVLLPIAFVLSIVSLFLHGDRKWMGIVGLIVAIVGTIVGLLVFFAVVAASFDDAFGGPESAVTQQSDEAETETAADADEAGEPPADTREELSLIETAFGKSDFDDTTWWYVAIFENPNEDYIFASTGITVEALDAGGTILDSSSDYRTILSGRTAIAGTFFSVGAGEITELAVRGPLATDATRAPASETGSFSISEVVPTTDSYSTAVHGKITSSFGEDQESVQVVVIARDAAGGIIAAETGYVDRLPSGGTAQFEVTFFDPLPGGTQYEAYAIL